MIAKLKPNLLKEEVKKDFYPIDCMTYIDQIYKDKQNEPIPIKEAWAFMKIWEGMYMEGIKLFLNLMEGISIDKIIKDE